MKKILVRCHRSSYQESLLRLLGTSSRRGQFHAGHLCSHWSRPCCVGLCREGRESRRKRTESLEVISNRNFRYGALISQIIAFLFFAIPITIWGQNVQLYGTIPSVLLKSSINDQLDYTVGVSSEINLVSKALGDRLFPAEILNLNLETALSYDVNPNLNLAGGFMYRFRNPLTEGGSELRPWQQLTLIHRFGKYRFRNRLRVEERWIASEKGDTPNFDVRLRYRVSADFPLEGERLDDQEFYLNVSTAVLITPTVDRAFYFWDSRTYLGLGYRFNSKHRLEPALEFRTRHIDTFGTRRHVLNFRIIWIAPLGG